MICSIAGMEGGKEVKGCSSRLLLDFDEVGQIRKDIHKKSLNQSSQDILSFSPYYNNNNNMDMFLSDLPCW